MMIVSIFGDLSTQFLSLMGEDRYPEARDLIEREGARFPDEAWHVTEWRVMAHALCGDAAQAVRILGEAVSAGLWYPEVQLRRDLLASLHGIDAFERLAAICEARQRSAEAETIPILTIVRPDGDPPHPLLIALHRNHSSAARDLPHWQCVTMEGWALAMPQSSQIVGPAIHIWNDKAKAVAEVAAHVEALRRKPDLLASGTIWAGFMTGGEVAVRMALGDPAARGFIAISPYVPDPTAFSALVGQHGRSELRGYVFIGADDTRCGPGARALVDVLRGHGLTVDLDVYPDFTFGYPPDFEERLLGGLDRMSKRLD